MDIRTLRYFLAVAEERNITRAAEYLCIAQPSLSKQMQNLEDEIGSKLFERGSRTITLTETGMILKKRAEEILDLVEKTETELSSPGGAAGEVRIGGGESYAVCTVAHAARKTQEEFPEVTFEFFSGDADTVMEKLEAGLIDFGIFVDLKDLGKYNSMRLPHSDTWGALVRKDSPLAEKESVSAEDLKNIQLLLSRQAKRRDSELYKWFGGNLEKFNVRARYNLIYNATLMVKEGMGVALTLDKLVNTTGDSDLVFIPLKPKLETHLDIVWKKYSILSKASEAFLKNLEYVIGGGSAAPSEAFGTRRL